MLNDKEVIKMNQLESSRKYKKILDDLKRSFQNDLDKVREYNENTNWIKKLWDRLRSK